MSYPSYDTPMLKRALQEILDLTRTRFPMSYTLPSAVERELKEITTKINAIAEKALEDAD